MKGIFPGWLLLFVCMALCGATRGAGAAVVFDWAVVGDPGNAADANGFGSEPQAYLASKHEVTNAQYAEFLNKVRPSGSLPGERPLYPDGSSGVEEFGVTGIRYVGTNPDGERWVVKPGHENKPVVFVSPVGAARFVNWLSNGQGGGGTESGSYTLGGGTPFARTPAARVFLPSADEWYKAAFYKGGSSDAGYWKYANASDTAPVSAAPGTPNAANYYRDDGLNNGVNDGYALTGDPGPSVNPAVNYVSDVGAYSATAAPRGIFDLVGNVNEWTELLVGDRYASAGGGFTNIVETLPKDAFPSGSASLAGTESFSETGFRVFATIPEPPTGMVVLAGVASLMRRWGPRGGK